MRLIVVLFSIVLLAGCGEESPEISVDGGWNSTKVGPHVEAAAGAAMEMIGLARPGARLRSIDRVEQQVVAGTNYHLEMTMEDGSRWSAQVFEDLEGNLAVTETKAL